MRVGTPGVPWSAASLPPRERCWLAGLRPGVGRGEGRPLGLALLDVSTGTLRIAEVPVHHFHRAFGRSQFFNFRRLARTAVDVARLWFQLVVMRRHRGDAAHAEPALRRTQP